MVESRRSRTAVAQFNLGNSHENGEGVARDGAKAAEWYRKAAEQGYADAQFNLGNNYADGKGIAKDISPASSGSARRLNKNDASAQFNLAMIYHHEATVRDHAEAARWYRKAADQGHVNAMVNLGTLYNNGEGVERDYAAALALYRQAEAKAAPWRRATLATCMSGEMALQSTTRKRCAGTARPLARETMRR